MNDQKFNFFYRQFRSRLLSLIEKKVPPGVAEEILQDTFLSAYMSWPAFSGRSSFFSWLAGIARHEIADYYRRQKIKEIVFSRLPFLKKIVSRALSPETVYEEKELKEKVKRTFARLSEGYCQILRLRYIDGLTVTELAKKLGISYKATESKLFRARLAFQRIFGQSRTIYQNWHFTGSS